VQCHDSPGGEICYGERGNTPLQMNYVGREA